MINWKPASEHPNNGRNIWAYSSKYKRGIPGRFNGVYYIDFYNEKISVTHWCELSELNLPAGGDV